MDDIEELPVNLEIPYCTFEINTSSSSSSRSSNSRSNSSSSSSTSTDKHDSKTYLNSSVRAYLDMTVGEYDTDMCDLAASSDRLSLADYVGWATGKSSAGSSAGSEEGTHDDCDNGEKSCNQKDKKFSGNNVLSGLSSRVSESLIYS